MNLLFDLQVKDFVEKCKKFKLFHNEHAMSEAIDIVMALIMIVVVGAIGVYIADQVVTQTGTPANANLSAMRTDLLGAGETGSGFIVILIIAFIGGVAISYMFGLIGRARRK